MTSASIKAIQISVSDGTSRKSLGKFSIKVVKGQPPTISGAPGTAVTEGQAYVFQPTAADSDLQTLRYGIINKPTWATFDPATGRLSGTPPKGSAGAYANVGISVTDGASTASLASFTITVAAAANAAPQMMGTPSGSVQVGQTYDFVPAAADADGDALRFAVVNAPSWASFDATTGRLTGKPQAGNEGPYADIVISVSDGKVFGFLPPFTITVAAAPANKPVSPSNTPPTISGTAPASAGEGAAYAFQPSASDVDGDTLTFSVSNTPAWLAINTSTGRLGGTPPAGSAGTYSGIVVTVSDGKASVSLPAFSITVTKAAPTNSPPTITGSPPTGVKAGQEYSFRATVADADGDALSYAIGNKPAWLNFNFTTGQLLGTPSDAQVGTYSNIRITVSDGKSSVALPAFSITVSASSSANSPPKISGSPAASVKEGIAYSFTPSASDPDGQALRFGIANMPAWAVFDNVTGRMSGTPAVGTAGVYSNIVISVSDGQVSATLPAFSVTVVPATQPNQAPTISGTPATSVSVGQAYSFQPGASDPDGQVLAFGIANKPDWANFDVTTGSLTGTPADADVAYVLERRDLGIGRRRLGDAAGLQHRRQSPGHRLGRADLDRPDPERGRHPADQPGGLQDPLRLVLRCPEPGGGRPEPGHHQRYDREPGRRHLVLHGRLVHQYRRRERPDRGRLQDDPVGEGTVPSEGGLSPASDRVGRRDSSPGRGQSPHGKLPVLNPFHKFRPLSPCIIHG